MAKKDADKFLRGLYKYVGTSVRKSVAKQYSETTFDVAGVAKGIKQGYDSIADSLEEDNAFIELTPSDYNEIGQAGVDAVREYATNSRFCEITRGKRSGKIITYISRRDIKVPHNRCKKAAVDKLQEIRKKKGGRVLRPASKDVHASQSEIGRVKSRTHKLHLEKTTVGSARLAAAMEYLTRTRDFGGFANSESSKEILDLYSQIEFLWEVDGTKKKGATVSLKEGQKVSMKTSSQEDNPAGKETFDWKNLKPKFEEAVLAYMIETGMSDVENSPSIRQNAKKMTTHAVVEGLTKGKKVTANKQTKASYRKSQSTKNTKKNNSKPLGPSNKQARTRRRRKKQESLASQPLMLLGMINKELPGVVRKNMMYPALENRTGAFASSVKIVDINQTPQGFPSIGYTYDKSPYSVFEDGQGSPPWSNGQRDPRDLIDKSIREIALKFALGRFYTRRL